jgi:hypothetical protein
MILILQEPYSMKLATMKEKYPQIFNEIMANNDMEG